MHELSIASNLVEMVQIRLADEGDVRVSSLRVCIGAMSGIEPQALKFGFDAASRGTALEGARLDIQTQDLVVWCPQCNVERTLPETQRLRCPVCDARTPRIIRGRELDLVSLEVCDE